MSDTLKIRVDRVITYFGNYDLSLSLDRPLVQQAVEWARDDVFYGIGGDREHLFQSDPTAIANGGPRPDDWLGFISGTVDGYPLRFIQIKEIPGTKKKGLLTATPISPKIYLCDNKINLLPASGTAMITYYQRPRRLYFDDPNLRDETLTDTMPADSEGLIARGAWEWLLMMIVSPKNKLNLTEIQQNAGRQVQDKYFEDITRQMNLNPSLL